MPRLFPPRPARFLRLAAAFLAVGFAAPDLAAALPGPVAERLEAADLPQGAMGTIVIRVEDGATLLSQGAAAPMQPASTLKVLTAIVALERLGPIYRGATELRSSGLVAGGVLAGDLIVRGGGDVDLDWRAFEGLLRSLRLKGIEEIRGDVVIDRGRYEPARADVGIAPFDEAPEFRYNVIPDALLVNSNLLQLDLASDGEAVRVATLPALDRVQVHSRMALVDRPCEQWEDGWLVPGIAHGDDGVIRVELRGEYPRQCAVSTEVSVLDRADFTDRLFRSLWGAQGGRFTGAVREGAQAGGEMRVLATHRSRPLAEIVRDINKRSDNAVTRVVYLELGAAAANGAAGNTAARSDSVVRDWLARQSIDATGLVLENGSGLSRAERISPAQLAAVLRRALASPWAPEFLASLPIAALDGGLRRRLQSSPAAQSARLKTGTLRDVSAIAGYVKDARGRDCIVVAMLNHPLATRDVARPVLDALVDWVAKSGALPAN